LKIITQMLKKIWCIVFLGVIKLYKRVISLKYYFALYKKKDNHLRDEGRDFELYVIVIKIVLLVYVNLI